MLAALGGRERWAALETVRIRQDVVFKAANGEAVVEVEQTRRFSPPAIRLKQKTPGGATYTNVVTTEEGWLRSPTGISPLPGTQVASWQNVLSRWFYYNVHRIATGAPELRTGLDDSGRIVLMDTLGELGRITLGEDGLPLRFELREGGARLVGADRMSVNSAQSARKNAANGHAQGGGLAIHGAASANNHVGVPQQV